MSTVLPIWPRVETEVVATGGEMGSTVPPIWPRVGTEAAAGGGRGAGAGTVVTVCP